MRNFCFHRNTRFTKSNSNTKFSVDSIQTVYWSDKDKVKHEVAFNLRNYLNGLKDKFESYNLFASSDIKGIFANEELEDALILKANYTKSSYIENLGKGNFAIKELPIDVQFAPVNGMQVEDFNQDGNFDLLLLGNDFGNELASRTDFGK